MKFHYLLLVLFLFFNLTFGQNYQEAIDGHCVDDAGYEPNYMQLIFIESLVNCTSTCDQLPTCSGVSYTPDRFKLKCNIYVFTDIQTEVEDYENQNYVDEEYPWVNTPTVGQNSTYVTGSSGNGGWKCYLRITDTPSKTPSSMPSTRPSGIPSGVPTTSPSADPSVRPSAPPSTLPSTSPSSLPSVGPTTFPSTSPSAGPSNPPSVLPSTSPSSVPSTQPTVGPSVSPTTFPSTGPTSTPSTSPSTLPSGNPTVGPTVLPTVGPTASPSVSPSVGPTTFPSQDPSVCPTTIPSSSPSTPVPSTKPTVCPSSGPSTNPSINPTGPPSTFPTKGPSRTPSIVPTGPPSAFPTDFPSAGPTVCPTNGPSVVPSTFPSEGPTTQPSADPSTLPSINPSHQPSVLPTGSPSVDPTTHPSCNPSTGPTTLPSDCPSVDPSVGPTTDPTTDPSTSPSVLPTVGPTVMPTVGPTTFPSVAPSTGPSVDPTTSPSHQPSVLPTTGPSVIPSTSPSALPSVGPTTSPSHQPSVLPTQGPSVMPSASPSTGPTVIPSECPSTGPSAIPSNSPSVDPTVMPSSSPTVIPSDMPSTAPTVTSPCSPGKLSVLGSHYIFLDDVASHVDDKDFVRLYINIPERYTISKVWPSDATTEDGFYYGSNTTYWSHGMRSDLECTQVLEGGFPWSGIRDRSLIGLTTVTDPTYYTEVTSGTFFHNVLTVELLEDYTAPEGWAKGEESTVSRKVLYEIPFLIELQTELSLTVNFSVVIPTPAPSTAPSVIPSVMPSVGPTVDPTVGPTVDPTVGPTTRPSGTPSICPSVMPTVGPTSDPSTKPTVLPTGTPSVTPSVSPSTCPTVMPSVQPTAAPTLRDYYYANVTVRSEDAFTIASLSTILIDDFGSDQLFEVMEITESGGYRLINLDVTVGLKDITPTNLGLFSWYGANVTTDTSMSFMAESQGVRVRIDVLLLSPRDCTASFTAWSDCSVTCNDGTRTRTWVVTDPADPAANCDYANGYVDKEVCNIEPCPLVDEVVTRFAVYNPNLDQNSTVKINFTTITILPWKVVDTEFGITDPYGIIDLSSVEFFADPIESCWPRYEYDEYVGLCGQINDRGFQVHPSGMFVQIPDLDATICKEVCDFFGEKCIGYDLWRQGFVCEVLGPTFVREDAETATLFIDDGRTFDWYEDEGTGIDGGFTFKDTATCYKKGPAIWDGYCFQDFSLCFDMDFVCNLDQYWWLDLTVRNNLTGTEVEYSFQTRMATDAACATIIGDAGISGELKAYSDPAYSQLVTRFYKGNTIYFEADVDTYANVQSMNLKKLEFVQSEADGASLTQYTAANGISVTIPAPGSTVVTATEHFKTSGRFSVVITDPVEGSVEGVYTKWRVTLELFFVDGTRRQLEVSEFTKEVSVEANTLIYPSKCTDPEEESGAYITNECPGDGETGKKILWCNGGSWSILIDECPDTPIIIADENIQSQDIIILESGDDEAAYRWKLLALTIVASIVVGACVYYVVKKQHFRQDKVAFEESKMMDKLGNYNNTKADAFSTTSEIITDYETITEFGSDTDFTDFSETGGKTTNI